MTTFPINKSILLLTVALFSLFLLLLKCLPSLLTNHEESFIV